MLELRWLDAVVLASYFVLMIGIGFVAARRVKNMDDYYLGGRRFGKAMMIMYAFGVGTHADSAVGLAAQTYKLGMAGIWYQWSQLFNTPFYWLLSPVFRRARCVTTADFYEMRYGSSVGILYSFWGVAINFGYLGVTLFGSARLIEALTSGRVPLLWSMVLMTSSFLLYSLIGGMIATVWNEFIQGILTLIMSFLLLPFLWYAVGGVAGFQAKIPNADALFRLVAPGEIGLFWIFVVSFNQVVGFGAQPHILSNNAAGRTELDNRVGFCAGVTLKRLCSIGWALAGVLAIAYYGKGAVQPDHVFGSLIRDLLPAGFAGLMIACIMASVMDNGAVFVLTTSALFTRNLLRTFRGGQNPRLELLVSRLFSIVYVCGSIALAQSFQDVPSAIRFIWALIPMIGIAFWLGLWWRRANRFGAWASFLAATSAWAIGLNVFGWTGDAGLPYLISFYLCAGIGAGVLVSLLTPPESQDRLDRFFLTINTPIGKEDKLHRFEEEARLAAGVS
ncbi:MAG: sodium:solute symporter family protein [Bryobacterales bacterium]|nr:sodium:solute symporter family protein [Bryobacterales bacterium]